MKTLLIAALLAAALHADCSSAIDSTLKNVKALSVYHRAGLYFKADLAYRQAKIGVADMHIYCHGVSPAITNSAEEAFNLLGCTAKISQLYKIANQPDTYTTAFQFTDAYTQAQQRCAHVPSAKKDLKSLSKKFGVYRSKNLLQ